MLKMIDEIKAHRYGMAYAELADRFDVDVRTIRRDLDALEQAGVLFDREVDEDDQRVRVRLADQGRAQLKLSARECYTLLAARGLLEVFDGSPFAEDMRSVFSKVAGALPKNQRADLEDLRDRFRFVPDGGLKSYPKHGQITEMLMQAVIHQHAVGFAYQAPKKKPRTGVLEPYAMVQFRLGLYVVGLRRYHAGAEPPDIRVFAVERFRSVEPRRSEPFEVPEGFDLGKYFRGAFGLHNGTEEKKVAIDFERAVATYVGARVYQEGQQIRLRDNGRIRLEFTATDLTEVVPFVLQWGEHATVVEPAELKEMVSASMAMALSKYDVTEPKKAKRR
jgi:proteasome accessory factor B